jgi:hypothetical protein
MNPWSQLEGWVPDPAHPGYLMHPKYKDCLRTADGRWWLTSRMDSVVTELSDETERLEGLERLEWALRGLRGLTEVP